MVLFAGPTPSTGAHADSAINQLQRLQTINYDFNIPRENIVVMGQLAAIDRINNESPTVTVDFSYLVTDMANENKLGFSVNSGVSALSNILQKIADDKNYFILVVGEGEDAVGQSGATGAVVGIGNGFISSYSTEGSVGGFPTATVNIEALNIRGYASGISGVIPAVNPQDGSAITGYTFSIPTAVSGGSTQATAIKPGDITVTVENGAGLFVGNVSSLPIQSYNISFDLSRETIQKLGTKYAFSKEIQFPVDVTVSIEALMSDVEAGNLADVLCSKAGYDVTVSLRQPVCTGVGSIAAQYEVRNAKLDSQNWSTSIGPSQTVSFNWTAQISASGDLINGLFMSGITGYA